MSRQNAATLAKRLWLFRQIHLAQECFVAGVSRQVLKKRLADDFDKGGVLLHIRPTEPLQREVVVVAVRVYHGDGICLLVRKPRCELLQGCVALGCATDRLQDYWQDAQSVLLDIFLLVWRVMHRGDVVRDVVCAAFRISERFEALATAVERMERTVLDAGERLEFAAQALAVRFPKDLEGAVEPSRFLVPRRPEDVGNDLWRTFNVLQENLLRGGIERRSASNRLTRTRRITAIREDVRLNSALWEMAIARAN